jgi:MacB-like protein
VVVPGKTHSEPWGATFDMCSEGYFETFGRHLLRGRLLSQSDVEAARQVAVVNQTLARNYFGNENPVGQRIRFSSFEMYADWPRDAYFEIIGVIEDARIAVCRMLQGRKRICLIRSLERARVGSW